MVGLAPVHRRASFGRPHEPRFRTRSGHRTRSRRQIHLVSVRALDALHHHPGHRAGQGSALCGHGSLVSAWVRSPVGQPSVVWRRWCRMPIGALDLPDMTVLAIIGLFAVVSVFSDLGVKGFRLPRHGRQVDRLWLDHYRSWVYGTGFGWQIGVGLATYIVTTAVYLTVLIAILTGSPTQAIDDRPPVRRGPWVGHLPRRRCRPPSKPAWAPSRPHRVRAGSPGR